MKSWRLGNLTSSFYLALFWEGLCGWMDACTLCCLSHRAELGWVLKCKYFVSSISHFDRCGGLGWGAKMYIL